VEKAGYEGGGEAAENAAHVALGIALRPVASGSMYHSRSGRLKPLGTDAWSFCLVPPGLCFRSLRTLPPKRFKQMSTIGTGLASRTGSGSWGDRLRRRDGGHRKSAGTHVHGPPAACT
jgi:hypothetical protein